MAVRLWGALGDTQTDRLRRLDRPARAARPKTPIGLPGNPKCPSWGATCSHMQFSEVMRITKKLHQTARFITLPLRVDACQSLP